MLCVHCSIIAKSACDVNNVNKLAKHTANKLVVVVIIILFVLLG